MIRNSQNSAVNPDDFGFSEASPDKVMLAEKKFISSKRISRENLKKAHITTFEYGIPGTHLIFSEPVLLSVDASDMPE